MHEIRTEIEIACTPQRLWAVLMDFAAYPSWNPFIRSITGSAQTGGKLTVAIQPSGGKAMTFRPTVLVSKAHSEFRWLGHFLFRGVFDGEHYFEITPIAAGAVRFVQGEKFSGALVGLAKSSLDRGTKAGFIAMNQSIKARAESASN
jgi:hypothetical protein